MSNVEVTAGIVLYVIFVFRLGLNSGEFFLKIDGSISIILCFIFVFGLVINSKVIAELVRKEEFSNLPSYLLANVFLTKFVMELPVTFAECDSGDEIYEILLIIIFMCLQYSYITIISAAAERYIARTNFSDEKGHMLFYIIVSWIESLLVCFPALFICIEKKLNSIHIDRSMMKLELMVCPYLYNFELFLKI